MALKPQSFGTALKNARKESRLTQAELAEKLDISLSYLKDLEYFRSLPCLELFVNVIEMFNLSADDVIHPGNNKNSSTYKKIDRLLQRCDEAQLNVILELTSNNLSPLMLPLRKQLRIICRMEQRLICGTTTRIERLCLI